MTICIAAITESKDIVSIADKMVTLTSGVVSTYEINENQKIVELGKDTVAMFAGNILNANEILQAAKTKIKNTDSVAVITTKIQEAYVEKIRSEVDAQILGKFGLTVETFMQQQQTLDQGFVNNTIQVIAGADLGVEIIVAGKDTQGAHLFKITNPGAVENYNPIGYVCIGSGSNHATLSLIESEYHPDARAENALYAIIKAKKKAEYDPGVGEMSTMVNITDQVSFLDDKIVKDLWKEFESSLEKTSIIAQTSSTIMKGIIDGTSKRKQ